MNRYHNKYHANRHHSNPAEVGDVEAGHDPIASESRPFNGSFYLSDSISITGDVSFYGDLDLNDKSIINCDATEIKNGVIRIATVPEVDDGTLEDITTTPRDLKFLFGESFSHDLTATDFHQDVLIVDPQDTQGLLYNGTTKKWENTSIAGVEQLATDQQRKSRSTLPVAVTPKQLYDEIYAQKPIYVNLGESATKMYNICPTSELRHGTCAFAPCLDARMDRVGNNGHYTRYFNIAVYQWNGTEFIRIR